MSHAEAQDGSLGVRTHATTSQATDPAQRAPEGAHGHHRYQDPPTVLLDGLSVSAWTVVARPVTDPRHPDQTGTLWLLSPGDRDRLMMAHAAGRVLIARQRVDGELLVVAKFARYAPRRRG